MRSAFGVEHGDEISKLSMAPIKGLATSVKIGAKNPNVDQPFKAGNKYAKALRVGQHLGRNKNAYTAGTAAGGTGVAGGYYAGSNNRKY